MKLEVDENEVKHLIAIYAKRVGESVWLKSEENYCRRNAARMIELYKALEGNNDRHL